MFEMTNENFARLLDGLTIAVGNRKNRILFYQFLAAEIRALHYSYGVGDVGSLVRECILQALVLILRAPHGAFSPATTRSEPCRMAERRT
jgi:hypothetical protein